MDELFRGLLLADVPDEKVPCPTKQLDLLEDFFSFGFPHLCDEDFNPRASQP
jgi:hypothetical protein